MSGRKRSGHDPRRQRRGPGQALVNAWRPAAQLSLAPGLAGLMVGVAVLLTLGTTVLVAWQPEHVRPLDVLRTE